MQGGRIKEGLAQEPFEDVARALASIARAASGDEVRGIVAPSTASWPDVIESEVVRGIAVDASVVVVSFDGLTPHAFRFRTGHGLEILEKVVRGQTWHE